MTWLFSLFSVRVESLHFKGKRKNCYKWTVSYLVRFEMWRYVALEKCFLPQFFCVSILPEALEKWPRITSEVPQGKWFLNVFLHLFSLSYTSSKAHRKSSKHDIFCTICLRSLCLVISHVQSELYLFAYMARRRQRWSMLEETSPVWPKWPKHCTLVCTMVKNSLMLRQLIIHFPLSLRVTERPNEWVQRSTWMRRAVWSERLSKRCEQTTKRISQWTSIYVLILFWTTVYWPPSSGVSLDSAQTSFSLVFSVSNPCSV